MMRIEMIQHGGEVVFPVLGFDDQLCAGNFGGDDIRQLPEPRKDAGVRLQKLRCDLLPVLIMPLSSFVVPVAMTLPLSMMARREHICSTSSM